MNSDGQSVRSRILEVYIPLSATYTASPVLLPFLPIVFLFRMSPAELRVWSESCHACIQLCKLRKHTVKIHVRNS